jgi:hypothetical protein
MDSETTILGLKNQVKQLCDDREWDEFHELADFLLIFAQRYDFDLSDELSTKITINEINYPISKAKGSSKNIRSYNCETIRRDYTRIYRFG